MFACKVADLLQPWPVIGDTDGIGGTDGTDGISGTDGIGKIGAVLHAVDLDRRAAVASLAGVYAAFG